LLLYAANIGGDFASFFQSLTFSPGSGNGAQLCSSLIVLPDNVTELEESFFIVLNLLTAGNSFHLGNNITHVTHTDDDGKTENVVVENTVEPLLSGHLSLRAALIGFVGVAK
jgi:hypothetical protein